MFNIYQTQFNSANNFIKEVNTAKSNVLSDAYNFYVRLQESPEEGNSLKLGAFQLFLSTIQNQLTTFARLLTSTYSLSPENSQIVNYFMNPNHEIVVQSLGQSSPVPSETLVLSSINVLMKSRKATLDESVKVANFTYRKISETSFGNTILLTSNNVYTMLEDQVRTVQAGLSDLKNDIQQHLQTVNNLFRFNSLEYPLSASIQTLNQFVSSLNFFLFFS